MISAPIPGNLAPAMDPSLAPAAVAAVVAVVAAVPAAAATIPAAAAVIAADKA